jgi:excisionase family DNA binding protein
MLDSGTEISDSAAVSALHLLAFTHLRKVFGKFGNNICGFGKQICEKRAWPNQAKNKQRKMTMKNDINPGQNPAQDNNPMNPQNGQASPAPALAAPLPQPLAYNINEAAAALNVSTKTIRRLLWRGKLTSCKVLRKILIPREQIANFLKATCDKPNLN